jgi:hypothetical protein
MSKALSRIGRDAVTGTHYRILSTGGQGAAQT